MEIFGKYSAFWALVLFLVIGLFILVRALLTSRRISREAVEEYEFRRADKALPRGAERPGFVKAYRRVYAPRKGLFTGAAITAIALLTIPAIALMEFLGELAWTMSGKPYEYGPETLLWQFMLFFAIIAFWGSIFFLAARFYHSRAPGSFEDELRKEIV